MEKKVYKNNNLVIPVGSDLEKINLDVNLNYGGGSFVQFVLDNADIIEGSSPVFNRDEYKYHKIIVRTKYGFVVFEANEGDNFYKIIHIGDRESLLNAVQV